MDSKQSSSITVCEQSLAEIEEKSFILGHRHVVALMGFLACMFISYHRLVLGVTIVAMVNQTNTEHLLNNDSSCPLQSMLFNVSQQKEHIEGEFNWNSSIQGYILGSSFLGYILPQVAAGRLAEIWRVKYIFILSNILASLFTFISPFAAWYHEYALTVVQFFRGVLQGFVLPSVYTMMAKWFPRSERGLLSTIVVCGYSVGAVFGGSVSGWLCDMPQFRWPFAFYFCAFLNILFAVFFMFFLYESPESHPNISKSELNHILEGQDTDASGKKLPLPWKAIFTSIPMYALFIGLFGYYWSMCYFQSVHATYMGTILHFGNTENGVLSSIPFFGNTFGGLSASSVSTWLLKKKYVGVNKLRKGCNSIGCWGFCLCLLGIYFAKCDATLNVVFFTLCLVCGGIALSGTMIACVDMSPNFAGSLLGMLITVASTSMFIQPIMVGQITEHQKIEEWHEVFFISIGVVFFCTLIFQIFGSAEVQPWNYADGKIPNGTKDGTKKTGNVSYQKTTQKIIQE